MIKVSKVQKGNNLLEFLKYNQYTFEDGLQTDYEINNYISILFLSVRFYMCKPDYIFTRINNQKNYKIKILLIYVDTQNYEKTIQELYSKIKINMVFAFSYEECARYIRGFEINATRPIDVIRRKEDGVITFLTSFEKVNSTDAKEMIKTGSNIKSLFKGLDKNLKFMGGIGKVKKDLLKKYLTMDFKP